jgi:cobalt/nickel transport system permease protein
MPSGELQRASCLDGESILHRCDARIKIVLLLTYLLTTALLPVGAWAVYLLIAGLLIIAVLLSELPAMILLKRSLLIEVPILLILLPQIFLPKGDLYQLEFFRNATISISMTGLQRVLSLLIRSWLSVQFVVLIAAVTRFEDMLAGLRAFGIPRLLMSILELMWRYLFVFMDEVQRMQRARTARSTCALDSSTKPGGSLFWRVSVTGSMAGTLMLRSLERSERIYHAMLSRGYDGEIRNGKVAPMQWKQRLWMLTFAALGILMILIAYGLDE